MHITYHIAGQVRSKEAKEVYQRPYKFNSRGERSRPWLLKPRHAMCNLSDDDIDGLNQEILEKYGHICAGK